MTYEKTINEKVYQMSASVSENAPLEVKMSGSSMILGKLIKHITTPDHDK